MTKRMLWIEDDFYAIKGLVRPLIKAGFDIDSATTARDGFIKAKHWQMYDLIVVDLILPLSNDDQHLPDEVAKWGQEEYVGVGLLKWLLTDLKVKCPVLLLSVVRDPLTALNLEDIGIVSTLPKRGLLPARVKEEVFRLLRIEENDTRDPEQAGRSHADD